MADKSNRKQFEHKYVYLLKSHL